MTARPQTAYCTGVAIHCMTVAVASVQAMVENRMWNAQSESVVDIGNDCFL